jgi:hypothetical protein
MQNVCARGMQSASHDCARGMQIVSERFMALGGERRTVPRLAEMLIAMPQLRHLDLFWEGHGENQSIMKDPKHMRTLAMATQLRCAPPRTHAAPRLTALAHASAVTPRPHAGAWISPSWARSRMARS